MIALHRALPWTVFLLVTAACGRAPDDKSNERIRGKMPALQSTNVCCIGRFQFEVPAGLVESGRSQSIYRVKVTARPFQRASPQKLIEEKVAQLRPLASGESAVVRRFDLLPGVPAVWYIPTPRRRDLHELMAVRPVGDYAVVAIRGGEAAKGPAVEELVGNVLNAYTQETSYGFCVGRGAITSEPGFDEDTLIVFSDPGRPNLEIQVSTETVTEPDTKTYSNLDEERRLASGGGSLDVLNEQWRTAAGLKGKQIWISLTLRDRGPLLRFTWHFPGVAESSSSPMINIVGRAKGENRAELEATWETLLSTLRQVPEVR